MKYTPRRPLTNPNVTPERVLIKFTQLFFGALIATAGIVIIAAVATSVVARYIPPRHEHYLEFLGSSLWRHAKHYEAAERRIDPILKRLLPFVDGELVPLRLHVIESEMQNAMAAPGGHLIVTSSLLKEAQSENEIAMVLGHEIGHFKNRDSVKRLGVVITCTLFLATILESNSAVADILTDTLRLSVLSYSRAQERAADEIGITLLNHGYGHVGGGTIFFERTHERSDSFESFTRSHPLNEERIRHLHEFTAERGFKKETLTPFHWEKSWVASR